MNNTGDVTAADFIVKNLIPVTIGNICGGAMFAFIQYLIYHPYIADDVELMRIKQGRRKAEGVAFEPKGRKSHQVPTNQDTMFRDISAFFWYHYCEFMQHTLGIVVYNTPREQPVEDKQTGSSAIALDHHAEHEKV